MEVFFKGVFQFWGVTASEFGEAVSTTHGRRLLRQKTSRNDTFMLKEVSPELKYTRFKGVPGRQGTLFNLLVPSLRFLPFHLPGGRQYGGGFPAQPDKGKARARQL
jgi:hypothetical protein